MNRTGRSTTLASTLATRGDAYRPAIRLSAVLFFTGLTAAAAQFSAPLPFTEVPFTLQPMVVLLAGLTLGSRLALGSQLLYLLAGIAGLPVFAPSATLPPGVLRLLGPTGGYLMSYPMAAWLVGTLADRGFDRRYLTSVLAMFVGLLMIYVCGTLWLAFAARGIAQSAPVGMHAALVTGMYPFLLADLLKILAAAGISPALWRLVGTGRR